MIQAINSEVAPFKDMVSVLTLSVKALREECGCEEIKKWRKSASTTCTGAKPHQRVGKKLQLSVTAKNSFTKLCAKHKQLLLKDLKTKEITEHERFVSVNVLH